MGQSGVTAMFFTVPRLARTASVGFHVLRETVRKEACTVLVGAGPSVQQRLLRASMLPKSVKAIVVPKLDAEHMFGLGGMLQFLAAAKPNTHAEATKVFGPVGFSDIVRNFVKSTESHFPDGSFQFVEMRPPKGSRMRNPGHLLKCELEPAELSAADGITYEIFDDGVSVKAFSEDGNTFSVVISESQKPPNLDVRALRKMGIPPGPIYREIKETGRAEWPQNSGRIVDFSSALSALRTRQKCVYVGDVGHSFLSSVDEALDANLAIVEMSLTAENCEEEASNAGALARKIRASSVALVDPKHFGEEGAPFAQQAVDACRTSSAAREVFAVTEMARFCASSEQPSGGRFEDTFEWLQEMDEQWQDWDDCRHSAGLDLRQVASNATT
mmetsp:Transcript_2433/g.7269  ORF Transcript_2433/g.7269 Transcript_2433/m.7269 type:complete len:386 (+) Transcript_2433:397-1554(+)|eukprot:CAMPEP_0198736380 /NCGR_PEP_ID=MMETSP1475-20131203/65387_1 /TAXON_ID= ORGANISM="Unidentified sp., Strain CCMP1999" /NCGR_SAMPLE_ID=MMETSP1475 /ASSEMBLY_ACC=CAM_ASM_001111 /LENGTH=385 /DNA_ID=CAMNT_0044500183 /DNA_START=254 /DNA_END=1411 /DNA_ORIENTATION=-